MTLCIDSGVKVKKILMILVNEMYCYFLQGNLLKTPGEREFTRAILCQFINVRKCVVYSPDEKFRKLPYKS